MCRWGIRLSKDVLPYYLYYFFFYNTLVRATLKKHEYILLICILMKMFWNKITFYQLVNSNFLKTFVGQTKNSIENSLDERMW